MKSEPIADDPVNAATVGKVLGISRNTIANLASDGILPRLDRGLFSLPACVQSYLRHKLLQAGAADIGTKSLITERSRLAKLKADSAERAAQVEAGDLVDVRAVEVAWLSVVHAAHSRLLTIPTKLASRIVVMKTAGEAQALLQKELYAALAGLANPPAL